MKRAITPSTLAQRTKLAASFVASFSLFALTYMGQEAQACDCMQQSVAQNFGKSDHVFAGRILFGLELPQSILYLSTVQRSYTGCAEKRDLLWVETERDWASCGTRFKVGESYLIFAHSKGTSFGFTLQTNACAGNIAMDQVTATDLEYLETRQSCCGGSCACQPGVEEMECAVDPCSLALPCDVPGPVRCQANNCGACSAEFYSGGERVCMGEDKRCTSNDDCAESEYCSSQGECLDDGSCRELKDCNIVGNVQKRIMIDCDFKVSCQENVCVSECKQEDPRCVDHEGYDFGDCEAEPGWLVLNGACQEVSSGCGTLVPGGNMPVFETKEACEHTCSRENRYFPCGKELRCNKTTSVCERSVPGVKPRPGDPTEYFQCIPLPERCDELPSCESCFAPDNTSTDGVMHPDGFPAQCGKGEEGGLWLSVAYP